MVIACVDDAQGRAFVLALLSADLPRGPQEIRPPVFGKHLRDARPDLRLRGVDAFLLELDRDPDRVLLRCVAGVVYRSRSYAPGDCSSAVWQSEERERCGAELSRDF